MASTISDVANELSNVLDRWSAFVSEVATWATGSTTGGPNGDGVYPITDAAGDKHYLKGLKLILDEVEGPAGTAQTAADEASAERQDAESAAADAESARDVAQSAEAGAGLAESNAMKHRDDAENSANNAKSVVQKRYPSDSKMRVPKPLTAVSTTSGDPGTFCWDDYYVYLKTNNGWRKIPLELL